MKWVICQGKQRNELDSLCIFSHRQLDIRGSSWMINALIYTVSLLFIWKIKLSSDIFMRKKIEFKYLKHSIKWKIYLIYYQKHSRLKQILFEDDNLIENILWDWVYKRFECRTGSKQCILLYIPDKSVRILIKVMRVENSFDYETWK